MPGVVSALSFPFLALLEALFGLRFFNPGFPDEDPVIEAGSTASAFSFIFSHEYGDGVAVTIVSQTMACESRTRVSVLSEEE